MKLLKMPIVLAAIVVAITALAGSQTIVSDIDFRGDMKELVK